MATGFQHPANLAQRRGGVFEMLEHPQANDEVERVVDKRQVLADAADDRHPRGAVLAQRGGVGIQPGRDPDVAPEQLDHATTKIGSAIP